MLSNLPVSYTHLDVYKRQVPEPMTLEPCESYGKEDLDEYVAVLKHIRDEAYSDPEIVKNAPQMCIRDRQ